MCCRIPDFHLFVNSYFPLCGICGHILLFHLLPFFVFSSLFFSFFSSSQPQRKGLAHNRPGISVSAADTQIRHWGTPVASSSVFFLLSFVGVKCSMRPCISCWQPQLHPRPHPHPHLHPQSCRWCRLLSSGSFVVLRRPVQPRSLAAFCHLAAHSLYFSITCVSQMFYAIIDVPHPHQRSFYLFYTFLIYVLVFVPHRGSSCNSIKCQLLSMSGPRLRCGVISVKMLAFLNLISCEYGASGKPQTADARRSPRKLKSLWQWQEYQFTHGDGARGKVPLTFNYSAVWVQNSKNTCEGKYCKIS